MMDAGIEEDAFQAGEMEPEMPARREPEMGPEQILQQEELEFAATSAADEDARVPVKTESFRAGLIAADVVFSPADTVFLQEARNAGCTTLDGLGMLVNQAVICFRLWTGISPNAAMMREELEEYLSV